MAAQVQEAPGIYLPHRRERAEDLRRVAAIGGVAVQLTGIPVELALAGTPERRWRCRCIGIGLSGAPGSS
ncbi:MAG: hypothetical protein ABWX59_01320 [Microbacteriaceae bacterium]